MLHHVCVAILGGGGGGGGVQTRGGVAARADGPHVTCVCARRHVEGRLQEENDRISHYLDMQVNRKSRHFHLHQICPTDC